MTNDEVLCELLVIQRAGLRVPARVWIAASLMEIHEATALGRSAKEVALTLLNQSLVRKEERKSRLE